jgi:hypothetical protein
VTVGDPTSGLSVIRVNDREARAVVTSEWNVLARSGLVGDRQEGPNERDDENAADPAGRRSARGRLHGIRREFAARHPDADDEFDDDDAAGGGVIGRGPEIHRSDGEDGRHHTCAYHDSADRQSPLHDVTDPSTTGKPDHRDVAAHDRAHVVVGCHLAADLDSADDGTADHDIHDHDIHDHDDEPGRGWGWSRLLTASTGDGRWQSPAPSGQREAPSPVRRPPAWGMMGT